MNNKRPANKVSDDFMRPIAVAVHCALDRFEAEGDSTALQRFKRDHGDEFSDALLPIYQADYDRMIEEVSLTIVNGLADIARALGVRFMSLNERDFICFENFNANYQEGGSFGDPASWHILKSIDRLGRQRDPDRYRDQRDLWSGCGNGPQSQINLTRLGRDGRWMRANAVRSQDFGIYDLRHGIERIHDPLTLETKRSAGVERLYDGGDLMLYLVGAGARHPDYDFFTVGPYGKGFPHRLEEAA